MNEITKELLEALKGMLQRDERNTCQHENVRRGGVIWTICEDCGFKWADDEGGMPEWRDPKEWIAAREAIAKAEAALAEPPAAADGWIPWSGGECPVHGRVPVEIQAKSGRKQTGPAEVWEWRHFGHRGDIIAYRIIKESGK